MCCLCCNTHVIIQICVLINHKNKRAHTHFEHSGLSAEINYNVKSIHYIWLPVLETANNSIDVPNDLQ